MKPRIYKGVALNQTCLVKVNHKTWYWLLYSHSIEDYIFVAFDAEKHKTVQWQQQGSTPQIIRLSLFDDNLVAGKLGAITDIQVYRNSYEALMGLQGLSRSKSVKTIKCGDVLICDLKYLEEMIGKRIVLMDGIKIETIDADEEMAVEHKIVGKVFGEWLRGDDNDVKNEV